MIGWLVGWLRDLARWVRDLWSLAEVRDRAVKAEQRLAFYEGQMGKLRRENRELREENVRLHAVEQFVAALTPDQLPEVPR